MKRSRITAPLLSFLALALAAVPLHAATTATWSGTTNNTLDTATNWSSGTVPTSSSATSFDTMLFDGTVAGNLALTYSTAIGGSWGVNIHLAGTETSTVDITNSTASSVNFRLQNITIDSGAGAFTMGDAGGAIQLVSGSGTPTTQALTNNSASTATLGANLTFVPGGSVTHTVTFTGSGNWLVAGAINNSGTSHINLVKSGAGTLTLTGTNTTSGTVLLSAGTLLLQDASGVALGVTTGVTVTGGNLKLGAAEQINNAATLNLGGGSVTLNGFNETMGVLTLASSSTIDFSVGGVTLTFGDSHSATWSGTLTLTNFTVGSDILNFGSATGLSAGQLSEISLSGYTATSLDSLGNVVFTAAAVPEPSSWALLAVGALLLVASTRRTSKSGRQTA